MSLERRVCTVWLICLLLLASLFASTVVYAQEPATVAINRVDQSQYPTLALEFQHEGFTKAQIDQLQLLENGQAVKLDSIKTKPLHVTVYLDAYSGLTYGELVRAAEVLDAFDRDSWFGAETTFSLWVTDSATTITRTIESTTSMLDVVNQVQERSTTVVGTTATGCSIVELLDKASINGADNYLFVLSNGFDPVAGPKCNVTSAISNSSVQVIFISIQPSAGGMQYFEQLASVAPVLKTEVLKPGVLKTTDCLAEANCEAFRSIWRQLARKRTSTLIYTTQQGKITDLTLQINTAGGETVVANTQPAIQVEPIQIQILKPINGFVASGTAVEAELQLRWPGPARKLASLEYLLDNGDWRALDLTQLDSEQKLRFSIPDLLQGSHSLHVRAVEAIAGLSSEQSASWQVNLPPTPTALPTPTATPLPTATSTPMPTVTLAPVATVAPAPTLLPTQVWEPIVQWLLPRYQLQVTAGVLSISQWPWVWIAIIAALLLGVTCLWLIRRANKRIDTLLPVGPVPTTAGYLPTTIGFSSDQPEFGELILIQGDGLVPNVIVLRQAITKIGRDFLSSHEVLSSRYVSHIQFEIEVKDSERQTGFILKNGSPAYPTMLNDAPITEKNNTLKSGDVISFGPFKYRFYAMSHPFINLADLASVPAGTAQPSVTR